LVDTARERRQVFAERYGINTVYDTVDQLLENDIPDIVSIIVPVAINPSLVIACAEAGVKVVSCEKPIAVSLAEADEMVRVCRERGTALGCGTAFWDVPYVLNAANWVKAGNIGKLTAAAIPGGLPREVSGGCCVQLTIMRLVTGMEVEWVEGWTLPPLPEYVADPELDEAEIDSPAYGRIGLTGGIICEVPKPEEKKTAKLQCRITVIGEEGQAWIAPPQPILMVGKGLEAVPVYPEFFKVRSSVHFVPAVERLLKAFDSGEEAQCSGHDYRQALEIACAFKLSAKRGHERVYLPLEDRSQRIVPQPYRLEGGDVAGWESAGPPQPNEERFWGRARRRKKV
jgi:hypothetical protein